MHAIATRKAKANIVGIVGIVGLAENMPDGNAQNPGDIVTSMSGQTIEVQNTDTEGCLVLSDALWYAKEKFKRQVMVALGHEHAGLFSNSNEVAATFAAASTSSTEKMWRLPLAAEYDRLIDSPIAEMKNIGGREVGSITAAQFLQRFVGKIPWVHLGIGTGMKITGNDPRETTLGAGFGVRLLNQWIAENYE